MNIVDSEDHMFNQDKKTEEEMQQTVEEKEQITQKEE